MTVGHIFVIIFMLITAGFVVWLEMNSRKNAKARPPQSSETQFEPLPAKRRRSRDN